MAHPRPPTTTASPGRRQRGFSLIEISVAAAITGVLSTLAWPALDQHLLKARRADATAALTRVQLAQAGHHAAHGLYASELTALRGASSSLSAQGLYALELHLDEQGYTATALALGGQLRDKGCERLELAVREGFARFGPSMRCWSR